MDPRLTQLPDPDLEARIGDLIHEWCSLPVDVCPCNPRPLPEPKRSATVRTIQRGQAAEIDSEPLDAPAGPDTRGTTESASTATLGPFSPLFPDYYRTGGAA